MAHQQQHGIAGRLFKAFEQGVGRVDIHRLDRLDQHHFAPAHLRGLHHEAHQVAHLVDLDGLVRFLGLQHIVVRVTASLEQQAGLALATCLQIDRALAQQAAHQAFGEVAFTDAHRPMQQIGVGVLGAPRQLLPEAVLPRVGLSHGYAPTGRATARR